MSQSEATLLDTMEKVRVVFVGGVCAGGKSMLTEILKEHGVVINTDLSKLEDRVVQYWSDEYTFTDLPSMEDFGPRKKVPWPVGYHGKPQQLSAHKKFQSMKARSR